MNKIVLKIGLILLVFLVFVQCNNKMSNKERFSTALDIQIPDSLILIKDEQKDDNWQDYERKYIIRLSEKSMNEFTQSIRNSHYYYGGKLPKDTTLTDVEAIFEDIKPAWVKTDKGYTFYKQADGELILAKVDTLLRVADFEWTFD